MSEDFWFLLLSTPLAGLGFGASLVSFFARFGGGIFTNAAGPVYGDGRSGLG